MSNIPSDVGDLLLASAQVTSRWRGVIKLVVIASLLLSYPVWWLSGAVTQALEASHRSSCNCRLKQFGLAFHNYHDTYGTFPPAFVLGPDGRKWHSWRVLILPMLEQQALYDEYKFDEPWDGPNNRKLLAKMPSLFACPSRPCEAKPATLLSIGVLACSDGPAAAVANGYTSYAAVLGKDCVFRGVKPVNVKEITDGTSNTLLIGECTRTKIPWTKPDDIEIANHPTLGDPKGFSGPHDGGSHFLIADGSVRFLSTMTPQATVDALFTRNGGELINDF